LNFSDKNLLILTNSYPDKEDRHYGGIFVKEQVRYLAKHFNEIYVISPQPYGSNRNLRDYEYDNVRVYYPRFFHLPIEFFRKRLGDNFFKASLQVIKREKLEFDLVHAHFTWPSGYAGALLKKELNMPLVITAHGFDIYEVPFRSEYYRRKVLSALGAADHIITVSKSNVEILTKKLEVSPGKVSLIPNGFDGDLFRPMAKEEARARLGLPSEKKITLTVGNLVPVKGHEYLIGAAEEVVKEKPNALFVIVGSGPLRKKLENLVRFFNIESYFYFAGARPHEEIPLWMNAADVFVLPSLIEGNPTVMFEALGVGLPFVGTAVGGVPEIIISDDYGLLCPPADPEYLAEKILIALEKEWEREKIRKYAERFKWESIANQILGVYTRYVFQRSFCDNLYVQKV